MTKSPPPEILDLIIRFSASIPDLSLTITSPSTTTPLKLKLLVRSRLPPPHNTCALRLISSGFPLTDTLPLTQCLRLSSFTPHPLKPDKCKGKEKANPVSRTIYIHCAISQPLDPSELAAEHALATSSTPQDDVSAHVIPPSQPTTSAPILGFDRLLSAGLSATEVAALRSQFLAIQAHSHTPDTMPSAAQLRLLEERWLDSGTGSPENTILRAGGQDIFEEDGEGSALEDLLWGNIIGFFWAVGAVVWLLREEGVWSRRRQIAVLTGMMVNFAFCLVKLGS